ncbi:MAG TPA: nucleotidyltransferase family protein [Chthoniobacterales bacterium]
MSVAAVVLAAGGSRRLGQAKQLFVYEGNTLVRRAVEAAVEAGCDPVVVVVGRDGKNVAANLVGTAVAILPNESWETGIGSSIRIGVAKIRDEDATFILTCDQPKVGANLLAAIIEKQMETQKPMIACRYAKTIGVPALFARACLERLCSLGDSEGAKSLLLSRPNDLATVDFPEGAIDIDTPDDFAALIGHRQKNV